MALDRACGYVVPQLILVLSDFDRFMEPAISQIIQETKLTWFFVQISSSLFVLDNAFWQTPNFSLHGCSGGVPYSTVTGPKAWACFTAYSTGTFLCIFAVR